MDTKGEQGRMNRRVGIDIYTLLYIKQLTNENLLCSTRDSVLCGDLNRKEIQKSGDTCTHTADSLWYKRN